MKKVFALFTLSLGIIAVHAPTQAATSEAAHQHGIGSLQIIRQGDQVQVDFSISAMDLYGFESEAPSKAQQAHQSAVNQALNSKDAVLKLDKCKLAHSDLLNAAHAESESDHDDHDADIHQDITLEQRFDCSRGQSFRKVATGFDQWLDKALIITYSALTPSGATVEELSTEALVLELD